ncbi:hypothetical protein N5W20_06560 [Candidatus Kirkpatrickella diaphorinae]|uniref:Uncharacterized protein n=1 Tax=Candidatus Kirkpatrickella diaphorinae TaxID=2984322 RepID=A0ABY6GH92_9PROT|nr:hypothetical protein [Candidatus Kirkpatrickella diaphorinae]UYH50775.1 hypothetical protein N5W20_06560 [Candidatus Kirkpatrickella diaphorinae]
MSPFSVCGTTARHGNLKIEEDFSNFEEMSKLAQSDYKKGGFRNVGKPGVYALLPDSYSTIGFNLSYIDGYGVKKSKERCAITILSPAYTEGVSELRGLAFSCDFYGAGEVNAAWLEKKAIERVTSLFTKSFISCVSFLIATSVIYRSCRTGKSLSGETLSNEGGPIIGPITYFGKAAIIDVLKHEPDMQPYGNGLLLRLTDDIANAERPEIVARLHAIRRKLQDAGIKSLEQGINRADWGCDGSSVLQGEPEFQ